jgi:hypothetical protein
MNFSAPVRNADGSVTVTVTLGSATVNSIGAASVVANVANGIAKATDLADIAEVAGKAYSGTAGKLTDIVKAAVKNKLTPPQLAQAALGFITDTLASAVDTSCLTQSVKKAKPNSNGSVSITRTTDFVVEKSNVYAGSYLKSRSLWKPVTCQKSSNCTPCTEKVCIRFLKNDGTTGDCGIYEKLKGG